MLIECYAAGRKHKFCSASTMAIWRSSSKTSGRLVCFVESVRQQINFESLLGQSYAFGDFGDDGLLISVTYKMDFPEI
jgi:hypothetical protein